MNIVLNEYLINRMKDLRKKSITKAFSIPCNAVWIRIYEA